MKKILTIFFVTLGVIFFMLILIGVYLFVFDPFGLRQMFNASTPTETPIGTSTGTNAEPVTDKNPILSPAQEKALETIGISPTTVPSSFTPDQEACFVKILGEARVAQIKAGDSPTPAEFFQAKSCVSN